MRVATPWRASLALMLVLAPLTAYAQATHERSTRQQSVQEQNPQNVPAPQQFSITIAGLYTTRDVETAGAAPSLDLGYSVTPDLYLHFYQPYAFDRVTGGKTHWGLGDTEIGVRYRFIQPDDNGWRPGVVVYPLVDFPTGDVNENLGTGRTHFFLPLWFGKIVGLYTIYGGGGYWYNRGHGYKDWWYFDGGAQRRMTDNLRLGIDISHATSSKTGLKETTALNVGGAYDITANHHILFSVGRGIQNPDETNQFTGYLGYQITF